MLIDTHCHLDAVEFDADRERVYRSAQAQQVSQIVIPAVHVKNFSQVRELAHSYDKVYYALGIHPLFVPYATEADLECLEACLVANADDPKMVAVGEIGLDFFVAELIEPTMKAKQEFFYEQQLRLAKKFNLPVLLHVRRAQDTVIKYLRKVTVVGGIAHAFNGSEQQAKMLLELGLKLGAGGAITYSRAKQIRRLVTSLPEDAWVLESDAPDMPPAWLHPSNPRNSPEQLLRIAAVMAELRAMTLEQVMKMTQANAWSVLPKLVQG